LAPRISEAKFLDLCAGSGAVGIEALSRGASHATFVDHSRQMRALIESNLSLCRVGTDEFTVATADALDYLRKASKQNLEPWDLIFFDPPYADDYEGVLVALAEWGSGLLDNDGLLVVEHFHKTNLPDESGTLHRTRILKQGDSALSFYAKGESVLAGV